MRSTDQPNRLPHLSATTLVAFVALAAALPGWQPAGGQRSATAEVRAVLSQPMAVRAMAVAVAAAARDFVNADSKAAITALTRVETIEPPSPPNPPRRASDGTPQPRILAQRLLDLPPPLC